MLQQWSSFRYRQKTHTSTHTHTHTHTKYTHKVHTQSTHTHTHIKTNCTVWGYVMSLLNLYPTSSYHTQAFVFSPLAQQTTIKHTHTLHQVANFLALVEVMLLTVERSFTACIWCWKYLLKCATKDKNQLQILRPTCTFLTAMAWFCKKITQHVCY